MATSSAVELTVGQRNITAAVKRKAFAEGSAGTGKTTAAVLHVGHLLQRRISAHEITIVVPQALLAWPYRAFEAGSREIPGAALNILTYGAIVRRAVGLFWPIVAEAVGHQTVRNAPVFLNAEAAQMHLSRVVDPLIEQKRLFETVRMPRRRIYTQVLDDLSKAAVIGFPVEEIGQRLQSAWVGGEEQSRMYDDVQIAASAFRAYCLEHGVLDFSLSVETFRRFIWPLDACRTWLTQSARYVIYDNVEEDHPAAHDLMLELIEEAEGALVMVDRDGSYRRFLGADEISAQRFIDVCDERILLDEAVGGSDGKNALIADFGTTFGRVGADPDPAEDPLQDVEIRNYKYFPVMVEAVCDEIVRLTEEEGVEAGQIAVVMPYLSDALRFAFINRLERRGVPVRSLRPSRPLGGEPAARCLLVLSQLAYPAWEARTSAQDVAQAFSLAIDGLDPVRAFLIASTYRPASGLQPFEALSSSLQSRITPELGERYERLRAWLEMASKRAEQPLDHFFARLYSELLAQPGYRFYDALDAGNNAAALVKSAREFRLLAEELHEEMDAARYVQDVLDGLIGEQALSRRDEGAMPEGVQVAPAYTFLMGNRPVSHQFWLDIGSSGWSERLRQPLSHPYVLSRNWPIGQRWTADDDAQADAEIGYRVIAGLLRRCTGQIWMMHVEYNEQGFTQQGPLLIALQRIMRRRNVARQGG